MKEFKDLKDEVRRLKRRIKTLEDEPVDKSSYKSPSSDKSSYKSPSSDKSSYKSPSSDKLGCMSSSSETSTVEPPSNQSLDADTFYNKHSKSELQDAIAHTDQVYSAVKTLMLMLFSEAYISSHSISGKAANTKLKAKPPFDTRLYNIMISLVKEKYPAVATKEITEKVHSVQK
jgi:hypothetical protein